MRIVPTVGRMVLFFPTSGDPLFQPHNTAPLAAQVADVYDEGARVNVGVLDRQGNHHARQRVPLVQEDDAVDPNESRCEWMPFQRGQAAGQGSDIEKRLVALEEAVAASAANLGSQILDVEKKSEAALEAVKGFRTASLNAASPPAPMSTDAPGGGNAGSA